MTAAASAREILTRLHDVMASRAAAQGKLNSVVNIIGESLLSEVCSIYLLREGALELYATRGLWSLALVWWAGRWLGNSERETAGGRRMAARLVGAVLILSAVVLTLRSS